MACLAMMILVALATVRCSARGPEWNDTDSMFELPGYIVEFE
jgi:hypothetical protein